MGVDHLGTGALENLVRRVNRVSKASPLERSSITGPNGQLRVADGAKILVQNAGMEVTGTERVAGTWYLDGVGFVTGTLTVSGNQIISGILTVGSMTLDTGGPYGGRITAPVAIQIDSPQFVATGSGGFGGALTVAGNFGASGTGAFLSTLANPGHGTTGSSANVFINTSTGLFSRVSSSSKYKLLPEEMELPDKLLDVPIEWWFDRIPIEQYAEIVGLPRPLTQAQQLHLDSVTFRRIPGAIAEKVAAAGGEAFVNYDADGEIDGLSYDRLALARTAINARRTAELLEQVAALTERIERLEASLRG